MQAIDSGTIVWHSSDRNELVRYMEHERISLSPRLYVWNYAHVIAPLGSSPKPLRTDSEKCSVLTLTLAYAGPNDERFVG